MEFKRMTEQQKEEYIELLEIDPKKELQNELVRTSDLENQLIREYGVDAARIVLFDDPDVDLYPLGEFPDDCPWSGLNDKGTVGFVKSVLKPLKGVLGGMLEAMKKNCLFIFVDKIQGRWTVNYVLDTDLEDGRKYFRVYSGDEPNTDVEVNESLEQYYWSIPDGLAQFYAIHDGFGDSDAHYILSSKDLRVLAEVMDPVCKEQDLYPEDYKFSNLLEFCSDGEGNAQCFYRKSVKDKEPKTVDWDHESWDLSYEMDFFEFVDECFSSIDE